MWDIARLAALLTQNQHFGTTLHHCRYGNGRRKLRPTCVNLGFVAKMIMGVNRDGRWATGDKTVYPWDLVFMSRYDISFCDAKTEQGSYPEHCRQLWWPGTRHTALGGEK